MPESGIQVSLPLLSYAENATPRGMQITKEYGSVGLQQAATLAVQEVGGTFDGRWDEFRADLATERTLWTAVYLRDGISAEADPPYPRLSLRDTSGETRPGKLTVMTRPDGRAVDALRPVRFTRGWLDHAEGSVLVVFGKGRGGAMSSEPINVVLERLERIEATLRQLVQQQTVKEFYSTEEFAQLVGKAEFTVREWCRHGRVNAQKRNSGRGAFPAWAISHPEFVRYQREGLLPSQRPV